MVTFTDFQFQLLKKYYQVDTTISPESYRLSLNAIFKPTFSNSIKDKFVIDFGCGHGLDTEELAQLGARLAYGIDIREDLINTNSKRNLPNNCKFGTRLPDELKNTADVIVSVDAFEHFDDPRFILGLMYENLHPGGEAYISFGPTWFHPRGGHTFSVFPWSHLILSEDALMKWRNQYYQDGATKMHEVAGGLNKFSINKFQNIFKESEFEVLEFNCKPIRNQKWLQKILGREFATSMVSVHLRKP